MQKLLIIGGVAAGATAAARARRLDAKAEITVLEAGPDVSFANCGLPYYIGGDIDSRSKLILQSPESFKSQYNVTVITETEALSIDRNSKKVRALHKPSGEEREYSYDSLILAQGGKPLVPPLKGVGLDHVFSLWTLQDMDGIDDFIRTRNPENAVVVGGGFIGLEMVEALRKRGTAGECRGAAPPCHARHGRRNRGLPSGGTPLLRRGSLYLPKCRGDQLQPGTAGRRNAFAGGHGAYVRGGSPHPETGHRSRPGARGCRRTAGGPVPENF